MQCLVWESWEHMQLEWDEKIEGIALWECTENFQDNGYASKDSIQNPVIIDQHKRVGDPR